MEFPQTPPAELARQLGISVEAVELARSSPFIDLHCDGFIWTRIFGYDLCKRHESSPRGGASAVIWTSHVRWTPG